MSGFFILNLNDLNVYYKNGSFDYKWPNENDEAKQKKRNETGKQ